MASHKSPKQNLNSIYLVDLGLKKGLGNWERRYCWTDGSCCCELTVRVLMRAWGGGWEGGGEDERWREEVASIDSVRCVRKQRYEESSTPKDAIDFSSKMPTSFNSPTEFSIFIAQA